MLCVYLRFSGNLMHFIGHHSERQLRLICKEKIIDYTKQPASCDSQCGMSFITLEELLAEALQRSSYCFVQIDESARFHPMLS